MSEQAFEILCPKCRSVVPMNAPGCPNCAPAVREKAQELTPEMAAIGTMGVKDYHRLVRANFIAAEGPRITGRSRGWLQSYLPFGLLLIGLIVGAVMALGRL